MLYSTVDDSNKNISKKQHIIQKSEEVAKRKKETFIEMKIIPKPYNGVRDIIISFTARC